MPANDRDPKGASGDASGGASGGASGAPRTLGGGAEAAQGVHGLQDSDGTPNDAESAGSEPLPRTREHDPSYGGAGGEPRTSSDQREPHDARGDSGRRVP